MKLYHATTSKKAKLYKQTGKIIQPVRGFDTLLGAMGWAIKTGRKIVYSFETNDELTHKLPDHHNKYGTAFWVEEDIKYCNIKCEFSGDK